MNKSPIRLTTLAWLACFSLASAAPVRLPMMPVRADTTTFIKLDMILPRRAHLDAGAPLRWRFAEAWAGFRFTKRKDTVVRPKLPIRIPFQAAAGVTGARLVVDLRWCPTPGPQACQDATADYLVVLNAGATQTATVVPIAVSVEKQ
ncbi:MAG TPA: hypothetical protein DEB40_11455 [Elusimicrobia bacterium]|nr:hypothetical protein [Elusimicrobiota bacterium]HBT62349.1 hypothetical protein [Elusimicrobiota bacterium]